MWQESIESCGFCLERPETYLSGLVSRTLMHPVNLDVVVNGYI